MTTWILIANSAEAHIYSATPDTVTPLTLEKTMSHRKSRLKGSALLTDRPGRVRKTATRSSVFAMEPHTAPKKVESEHFAAEVAAFLETAFAQRRYDLLVLAAPAHFLGLLTDRLKANVSKQVVARLHKDLLDVAPRDLRGHLQPIRAAIQAERRRRAAWS